MYRITKAYYKFLTPDTSIDGGTGSALGDLFLKEIIIMIKLYLQNDITGFNLAYGTTYENLKTSNSSYVLDTYASSLVDLIEIIYSLIAVNADLKRQISILENEELALFNQSVNIKSVSLNQDTSLKLEYLQYLLLYDINLTNGLFIDSYLEVAKQVLDDNGGQLKF